MSRLHLLVPALLAVAPIALAPPPPGGAAPELAHGEDRRLGPSEGRRFLEEPGSDDRSRRALDPPASPARRER